MKVQLIAVLSISVSCLSWAVPSEINYQGRLTDASGDPVTGDVSMSIKVFDAPMNGNELYSEDIGAVTLDDNGVYSFQFGASGQSLVNRSEIIAISDGTSRSYNKTLSATPLEKTLAVGDGTYSWDVVNGNPGGVATATATVVNGFVIGVTVGNGGSGYTNPPLVTISGNGTGATASAVVSNGVVTAINIENTGSGYTSATISIATPPAPFVVDYSGGLVSVAYESAPSSGIEIIATYKANDSSIVGALSAAEAHWFELSVDGVSQSSRERVLAVPFAQVALNESAKLRRELEEIHATLFAERLSNEDDYSGNLGIPGSFKISDITEAQQVEVGSKYLPNSSRTQDWDIPNITGARALNFSRVGNSTSYIERVKLIYTDGTVLPIAGGLGVRANPHPEKTIDRVSYISEFRGGGSDLVISYLAPGLTESVFPLSLLKPYNYVQIAAQQDGFEGDDLLLLELVNGARKIQVQPNRRNKIPEGFIPQEVKATISTSPRSSASIPRVSRIYLRFSN
ncbi:MAG: hypothetical protein L7U83_00530 [Akkermansiaceae bacterium]|nr:hypothetical protein [Akkermansiaceae bacterium]